MAEKIRLGNDIGIDWSLIDEEGNPYNLEGKDVSIEIVVGEKKRVRIKEVSLSGNTVSFVYYGKDQKYTGRCDLKFIENNGEVEMVTFDTKGAFELVAHSWLIGGAPENERVQLSFVTVTSELTERVGPKGDSAGFGEITAEVDDSVGTPSVEVTASGPDTAKNITFSFHNLKGEPGDIDNLTKEGIENALGYTPADDSEVVKSVKSFAGQSLVGTGDLQSSYSISSGGALAFEEDRFVALISFGEYGFLIANGGAGFTVRDFTHHSDFDANIYFSTDGNTYYIIRNLSRDSYEAKVVFLAEQATGVKVLQSGEIITERLTNASYYKMYSKPASGIPASDLASGVIPDTSQFITKTVSNLTNYYLKSQTYTKEEVTALIGAIQSFHYEIAASTAAVSDPKSNVLYLIGPIGSGSDKYEEYIYVNNEWVKIGDTSVDLSGYYQKPSTGIPKTDLAAAVQTSLTEIDRLIVQYGDTLDFMSPQALCYVPWGMFADLINLEIENDLPDFGGETLGMYLTLQNYQPGGTVARYSAIHTMQRNGVNKTYLMYALYDGYTNTWSLGYYEMPTDNIPASMLAQAVQTSLGKADTSEQASNKVTTLSSSSTDVQYPSAKAVYDALGSVSPESLTTSEIDTIWNNAS